MIQERREWSGGRDQSGETKLGAWMVGVPAGSMRWRGSGAQFAAQRRHPFVHAKAAD